MSTGHGFPLFHRWPRHGPIVRRTRIPAPPEIFRQFLQACKTFRQMGKQRLHGIHLFHILLLPGGEVAISGVDMDLINFRLSEGALSSLLIDPNCFEISSLIYVSTSYMSLTRLPFRPHYRSVIPGPGLFPRGIPRHSYHESHQTIT